MQIASCFPARREWASAIGVALARVAIGVLWLSNLPSKTPMGSGCGPSGDGVLCSGMQSMAQHGRFGLYRAFISDVVIPHYRIFAALTLSIEWLAGCMLLLGLFTRLGAALGLLQATNLALGLMTAPGEWLWTYPMLALLHLLLLVQARHEFGGDALWRALGRARHAVASAPISSVERPRAPATLRPLGQLGKGGSERMVRQPARITSWPELSGRKLS